ncbi:MAG: hypothetical protein CFE45_24585 [Burkholderiales bacterium PBB5]|nr:MAG: hypothetical protein CFE45_24585 [Burkholderiales bacterium PBB5]
MDYLKFTRDFNAKFPGFATDVHGLVEEDGPGGTRRYYVDCVRLEAGEAEVAAADAVTRPVRAKAAAAKKRPAGKPAAPRRTGKAPA